MKKDPLSGPIGAVAKFLGAALFGGFVSLLLLGGAFWLDMARGRAIFNT